MANFDLAKSFDGGEVSFNMPLSPIVFGDYLYVNDSGNDRILVYYASSLKLRGMIEGFDSPSQIAVNNDNIFVPDGDNVYIYSRNTFNHRKTLTFSGSIQAVTVDRSYLYVLDSADFKLHKFRLHGMKLISTAFLPSDSYTGISVSDRNNYLFLFDITNQKVVVRSRLNLVIIESFDNDIVGGVNVLSANDKFLYVIQPDSLLVYSIGNWVLVATGDFSDPDSDGYLQFANSASISKNLIYVADASGNVINIYQKYRVINSLSSSSGYGVVDGKKVIVGIDELIAFDDDTPQEGRNDWVEGADIDSSIAWSE